MIVKTKKTALDKNTYVKMAFGRHIKSQWFWLLIPAAVLLLGLILRFTGVYKNIWIPIVAIIGAALYVAFWYAQFYYVTQAEQNKQVFDKFMYEIDSRQILAKINQKEGGIIKWEQIQAVEKTKDAYWFVINKAQYIHLPFNVFNSEHDIKLLESILNRKNLLK
jgi:YcxB-like protein